MGMQPNPESSMVALLTGPATHVELVRHYQTQPGWEFVAAAGLAGNPGTYFHVKRVADGMSVWITYQPADDGRLVWVAATHHPEAAE